MQWEQLLNPNYIYASKKVELGNIQHNYRSIFERNYDRIIFSTPFRKLQNKTQVIPLPEYDFVHNRLTHSLEVSSVGKSLGKIVGGKLLKNYPHLAKKVTADDFGNIVASACLAHDIGNPPFGHSGEKAIGYYFDKGEGQFFKSILKENQSDASVFHAEWQDLIDFEGNANGFRILTRRGSGIEGGFRLSFAILGAFIKYPKASFPKGNKKVITQKKYNYFQTESDYFQQVITACGLEENDTKNRHPLAFLMEAADDICYHVLDFEDGLRLGMIPFEKGEELFMDLLDIDSAFFMDRYNQIADKNEKIGYLRAMVINQIIQEVSDIFIQHEAELLNGSFNHSLTDLLKKKEAFESLQNTAFDKVYSSQRVLEIEAAGFEILPYLMDVFCKAIYNQYQKTKGEPTDEKYKKYHQLLPETYTFNSKESLYSNLINTCEFVASLTDTHAVALYKRLKGVEIAQSYKY